MAHPGDGGEAVLEAFRNLELVPALAEAHRATLEGRTAILNVVLG